MVEGYCRVEGGRLVAGGDLSHDSSTQFDRACRELLAGPAEALLVDLSAVTAISSTYVGLLGELGLGARAAGKPLTVRAGPRVAAVLREAGLDAVISIEAAPPAADRN